MCKNKLDIVSFSAASALSPTLDAMWSSAKASCLKRSDEFKSFSKDTASW
jgi:hypothetical protein